MVAPPQALRDVGPTEPRSRLLQSGIALKAEHVRQVLTERPGLAWFEVHAENVMGRGGPCHHWIDQIRQDYRLSFHAVGLSLGSADGVDLDHLERFARVIERFEPDLVSEHLSWSSFGGVHLNDLLPLPYSEEALDCAVRNITAVQERLKRRLLIENPSRYGAFEPADLSEPEFLNELVARTGCGLLLDVNNVHVSCSNLDLDPVAYLMSVNAAAVGEIHLAGHTEKLDGAQTVLIDDHGSPVADPVWRLYRLLLERVEAIPTLIEWDTDVPSLEILIGEAEMAERFVADVLDPEVCHAAVG